MKATFWHKRWSDNNIGFHSDEVNPFLINHISVLSLPRGSRVFVPLCGKTRDIAWLLSEGYSVVGVELSELAIQQLFADMGRVPRITRSGSFIGYSTSDITIYVGDFFQMSRESLGTIDAIFDRAAIVALPDTMRTLYTQHIISISGKAPQLLITYEYTQELMPGPPFAVSGKEVHDHYQNNYEISLLESAEISGGLKGISAREILWHLQ